MLKSLEVLRTVEMEAIERSKARQAREARLAERAAVGAKTQWKKAGGRVSVARLKLDLSTKRVVEDGTVVSARAGANLPRQQRPACDHTPHAAVPTSRTNLRGNAVSTCVA